MRGSKARVSSSNFLLWSSWNFYHHQRYSCSSKIQRRFDSVSCRSRNGPSQKPVFVSSGQDTIVQISLDKRTSISPSPHWKKDIPCTLEENFCFFPSSSFCPGVFRSKISWLRSDRVTASHIYFHLFFGNEIHQLFYRYFGVALKCIQTFFTSNWSMIIFGNFFFQTLPT